MRFFKITSAPGVRSFITNSLRDPESIQDNVRQREMIMNIDDLLKSTKPILYETEMEEWPYAFSGTCYPVKYNKTLFIVSAFHCYNNFKIEPENTLYPRPEKPTRFLAFDTKVRARAQQSKDDEHFDQVVLRVARSHHPESETDKVFALDLAYEVNWRLPNSKNIKDFMVRGYPFDCPKYKINYQKKRISYQGYTTNGVLSVHKSPFDFCYLVRMIEPIPNGMSPNGMSGSPIYGINQSQTPVYCGTIIKYSNFTDEYLVIGPEVLVNTLKEI